jgi:hypothetical protein
MMYADRTVVALAPIDPCRLSPPPLRRGGERSAVITACFSRIAAAALLAVALVEPAAAQPVKIVWSTYLRTGPGSGYAVVDEIQHDTLVDLRSCGAHWCQILSGRTVGYVDRDSIKLPRLPSGGAAIGGVQGCFVTGQYAWRTPAQTRFCETKPGR